MSMINVITKNELIDVLKLLPNYDETKTQILKNVNGTIEWLDE